MLASTRSWPTRVTSLMRLAPSSGPDGANILELAVNGEAIVIVTRDDDLLLLHSFRASTSCRRRSTSSADRRFPSNSDARRPARTQTSATQRPRSLFVLSMTGLSIAERCPAGTWNNARRRGKSKDGA